MKKKHHKIASVCPTIPPLYIYNQRKSFESVDTTGSGLCDKWCKIVFDAGTIHYHYQSITRETLSLSPTILDLIASNANQSKVFFFKVKFQKSTNAVIQALVLCPSFFKFQAPSKMQLNQPISMMWLFYRSQQFSTDQMLISAKTLEYSFSVSIQRCLPMAEMKS